MTPAEMAALHARCFVVPRPWRAAEFAALGADPAVLTLTAPQAVALFRRAGDEAELLTLAVAPEARRAGVAASLLDRGEAALAQAGVAEVFLEVAADNVAARALYARAGYAEAGVRRGYYRAPDGAAHDALVLRRALASQGPACSPTPEND